MSRLSYITSVVFCSHKDMYHHLGKFSDEPCERYEKKEGE